MEEEGIEYIRCSSSKRISKYHSENTDTPKYSVKVVRKLHETDQKSFSDINEATDLFSKFSNAHAVNRLHCNLDILATPQKNRIIDLINTGPQPRFNNI